MVSGEEGGRFFKEYQNIKELTEDIQEVKDVQETRSSVRNAIAIEVAEGDFLPYIAIYMEGNDGTKIDSRKKIYVQKISEDGRVYLKDDKGESCGSIDYSILRKYREHGEKLAESLPNTFIFRSPSSHTVYHDWSFRGINLVNGKPIIQGPDADGSPMIRELQNEEELKNNILSIA